jgi:subtilisin family serine protease
MLGAGGTGVAPQAQWIAARLYNGEGRASMSDIHRAFQWLMDPDGDASTLDAPDVVNASWSLSGRSSGRCVMEFADDIRALKAAGIAVVFAAGNDGPQPGTSNSPGNNPGVLSVGAAGRDLEISRSTSRGPSACDAKPYPGVLAPGVGIFTTDLSHGGLASYTTLSGSSLAAPHASGVLALLAEAFPGASVAELESALLRSTYHHGIIDAQAAFQILSEAVQGQQKRVPKP